MGGDKKKQEEWEERETAHPRLGVHPSLESVCAVITVSNRWDDAWEERACARARMSVCWHELMLAVVTVHGCMCVSGKEGPHNHLIFIPHSTPTTHTTSSSSTVICHP